MSVSPVFFQNFSKVLGFALTSLIPFELIFTDGVKCGSSLFFKYMDSQSLQDHLLRNNSPLNYFCMFVEKHRTVVAPLWKINWLPMEGSISGLSPVPLACITVSILLYCLAYYSFTSLKSGRVHSLTLSFEVILAALRPLHFHMNYRISLLISTLKKKQLVWDVWDVDQGHWNQQINSMSNNILSSPWYISLFIDL